MKRLRFPCAVESEQSWLLSDITATLSFEPMEFLVFFLKNVCRRLGEPQPEPCTTKSRLLSNITAALSSEPVEFLDPFLASLRRRLDEPHPERGTIEGLSHTSDPLPPRQCRVD